MRYLNRLIFINSAGIPYAEILVNGNVHLIGNQGVGKSTLLRAILFFYNADTLKLGISREKKSFSEYYFPYQNSYIIYEVVRETGAYCIISSKSQGKVAFRFFDSEYDKRFFLTDAGQAFEKWEDTRQQLDKTKIAYTGKIDRYGDYRDIIYGNTDTVKKELTRYSILQSRQYQNIPRTIQNVFLNSKLEAEFIKQTIIMSLNEEEITIDLQNYTHHLKNFEEQLYDINQFRQPIVQKQLGRITLLNQEIRQLEAEKLRHAQHLSWAAAHVERQLPRLHEKTEKLRGEKAALEERLENARVRHLGKVKRITGEISVQNSQLKDAKEKGDYYASLNIAEIIERVSRKDEHQTRLKGITKELGILGQKYGAVADKYDALLSAHDNNSQAFLQQLEKELLRIQSDTMLRERQLRAALDQDLGEIKKCHQATEQELSEQVSLRQNEHIEAIRRLERTRHIRFRESELQAIQQLITELGYSTKEAKQKLDQNKAQTETIRKQWELEEAKAKQEADQQIKHLEQTEQQFKQRLATLEGKLANSSDAFYGWLNDHVPGWEQHIGKVADEQVLFSLELSPARKSGDGTFYGVDLKLDELPVKVKTLEEYESERNGLLESIEQIASENNTLQTALSEDLEKLKKKYGAKLRECRDGEQSLNYQLNRDQEQVTREILTQKELLIAAEEDKTHAMQKCDAAVVEMQELLEEARLMLRKATLDLEKRQNVRRKESELHQKELLKEERNQQSVIDGKKGKFLAEAQVQRESLLLSRNSELSAQGVDTGHIDQLEGQKRSLEDELSYIDQHRDIVAVYRKDKEELIDKVDTLKTSLQLLEQQLQAEEQRHQNQQEKYKEEATQIDEQLSDLKDQRRQALEDEEAFKNFALTSLWESVDAYHKQERESFKTERRCKVIIEDLYSTSTKLLRCWDDLKETTNRFLGNFSVNNIFSFRPQLHYHEEYKKFAEELDEFAGSNKIEEFEKRVNDRFASIIHLVGKETDALMSKEHEIQKVINDINRDFESKNFVTAIQKIELRVDESANTIVRLLQLIKKYNDEHIYELGAMSLFSSADQNTKNRKAIDLLKQLAKAIAEQKSDTIALSDTFELKFRVEENQNDSGWVEKLSNVGSEGTDVLVKAMINIMLLNVFKEGASRRFKDFRLHCMMDEIGKLHPVNVKGILQFANDRNINLVNGSPTENNALDYKHIYRLEKDSKRNTRVKRIITNHAHA